MTKATLWPRILDRSQRHEFLLGNLNCLLALRDSLSALQLGRDDSRPEFPAVISDTKNPKAACQNHRLQRQVTKADSVGI
jgi:hypothetical protein